jgi:hypothetical protein
VLFFTSSTGTFLVFAMGAFVLLIFVNDEAFANLVF